MVGNAEYGRGAILTVRILTGDCRDILPTLEAGLVHCVVLGDPIHTGIKPTLVVFQRPQFIVQEDHFVHRLNRHTRQFCETKMPSIWRVPGTHILNSEDKFGLSFLEDQVRQASLKQWDGDAFRNMSAIAGRPGFVRGWIAFVRNSKPLADCSQWLFSRKRKRDSQNKARRSALRLPLALTLKASLAINQSGEIGVLVLGQFHVALLVLNSIALVRRNDY